MLNSKKDGIMDNHIIPRYGTLLQTAVVPKLETIHADHIYDITHALYQNSNRFPIKFIKSTNAQENGFVCNCNESY